CSVQFLPVGPKQGRIGGVLHKRVLECVESVGWGTAHKNQTGADECLQGSLYLFRAQNPGCRGHSRQQSVRKLPSDDRTGLRGLARLRSEMVETSEERGVQGIRHIEFGGGEGLAHLS